MEALSFLLVHIGMITLYALQGFILFLLSLGVGNRLVKGVFYATLALGLTFTYFVTGG